MEKEAIRERVTTMEKEAKGKEWVVAAIIKLAIGH